MGFSEKTAEQAFNRQGGKCALCGDPISLDAKGNRQFFSCWCAHHIESPDDDSEGNCACVHCNDLRDCHIECHLGSYDSGKRIDRKQLRLSPRP